MKTNIYLSLNKALSTKIVINVLLCICGIFALSLTSCEKDNTTSQKNSENEFIAKDGQKVTLGVTLNGFSTMTKASNEIGDNDKNIESLQVLAFRENGELDAYAKSSLASVKLNCTTGKKTFYAIVNGKDFSKIKKSTDLLSCITYLKDNAIDKLQMFGSTQLDVKANTNSVSITATRIPARISIEKIILNFQATAYKNSSLKIEQLYVTNVAAGAKLGTLASASEWINLSKFDSSIDASLKALTYEQTPNISIKNGTTYNKNHYFYVYPHEKGKQTRLVIEGSIDGKKYFFPINISDSIESNMTYTITELTITRPGSEDSNTPVCTTQCNANITIEEWKTSAPIKETI